MNKLDNIREALTFDDVLIVPRHSSLFTRSEAKTEWKLGKFTFQCPVISANMDTITGLDMAVEMAKAEGLGIIHRYMSVQEMKQLSLSWSLRSDVGNRPLALSVGTLANDQDRIDTIINEQLADIICVDIAHGDSLLMYETLQHIRASGFTGPIVAGNVVTPEAVAFLLEAGATIVKVGVGPGSVCTTRIKTGCGFPQLEAVARCAEAGPIIADGGIRTPGDAAKALAAGATAVMVGGMLAGTDKVPGWIQAQLDTIKHLETITDEGAVLTRLESTGLRGVLKYRGMASNDARKAFGQEETNAEGISMTIACRPLGSTRKVITDIMEGVRSAMSYTGSYDLEEFRQRAEFVRVTGSVQIENNPHFSK